jgi:putative transposase
MKKPRYTEQQIAQALREAKQSTPAAELCRKLGVSETTFYAWKKNYADRVRLALPTPLFAA